MADDEITELLNGNILAEKEDNQLFDRLLLEKASEPYRNNLALLIIGINSPSAENMKIAKKILEGNTRGGFRGDVIGQYNPDEFAVLLVNTTAGSAEKYWARVNLLLENSHIISGAGLAKVNPNDVEETKREVENLLLLARERVQKTGESHLETARNEV
ncbi:hypothetical protein HY404_00325 [Candidatus Microgenomates bacterium]|nr:hypothetical protein [Candidatus Microgenomates bacterium]